MTSARFLHWSGEGVSSRFMMLFQTRGPVMELLHRPTSDRCRLFGVLSRNKDFGLRSTSKAGIRMVWGLESCTGKGWAKRVSSDDIVGANSFYPGSDSGRGRNFGIRLTKGQLMLSSTT